MRSSGTCDHLRSRVSTRDALVDEDQRALLSNGTTVGWNTPTSILGGGHHCWVKDGHPTTHVIHSSASPRHLWPVKGDHCREPVFLVCHVNRCEALSGDLITNQHLAREVTHPCASILPHPTCFRATHRVFVHAFLKLDQRKPASLSASARTRIGSEFRSSSFWTIGQVCSTAWGRGQGVKQSSESEPSTALLPTQRMVVAVHLANQSNPAHGSRAPRTRGRT